MLGVYGLVPVLILWFYVPLDVFGKGGLAQFPHFTTEIRIGPVVEEPQGTPAGCGIVNDFCHQGLIFPEIELVPNTDLPGRVHQDVPKSLLLVEFPEMQVQLTQYAEMRQAALRTLQDAEGNAEAEQVGNQTLMGAQVGESSVIAGQKTYDVASASDELRRCTRADLQAAILRGVLSNSISLHELRDL